MKYRLILLAVSPFLVQALAPLLAFSSTEPDAGNKLATYSKPAVVRIFPGCSASYQYRDFKGSVESLSAGTGFFIDPNGYIATNAHVVNKKECEERLLDQVALEFDNVRSQDVKTATKLTNVRHVQRVMLSPKKILDYEIREEGDSKDVAILKVEVKDAPILDFADSDSVQLGDIVAVIGYPGAADLSIASLTDDDELSALGEATVSLDGKISNNQKVIPGNQTPVLQLDGLTVSRGSSGSPVLNEAGQVIGMITFGSSDDLTTIPFAITADTVQDYVRSSGASLEESKTNFYYREGLDFFWKGRTEKAKKNFEAVLGLYPYHLDAENKLAEIAQIEADVYTQKSYRQWLTFALGGVVLLAAGYGIARYRLKPSPATPMGALDSFISPEPPPMPQSATRRSQAPSDTIVNFPTPSPTMMDLQPYLLLRDAQGKTQRFELTRPQHFLGRGHDCDLRLPDDWQLVSKHHAVLKREGQSYRIYDGDGQRPSTNKLFINGTLITPTDGYLLSNSDQLQIGQDAQNHIKVTYTNPAAGGDSSTPGRTQRSDSA